MLFEILKYFTGGKMKYFKINPVKIEDKSNVLRNSIGGYPILAEDQELPFCKLCGENLSLFLQFDIPENTDLPFKAGSHFCFFSCPFDADPPQYDLEGESAEPPPNFWESYTHTCLIFNPPGTKEKVLEIEPRLVYCGLNFDEKEEKIQSYEDKDMGVADLKIGGIASWLKDPMPYECTCGSDMKLICQVPLGFQFQTNEEAEPQNNWTESGSLYYLMNGNEVYMFACPAQCTPLALAIESQAD